MIDGAQQTIVDHRIDQLGIAHGGAAARTHQQVRRQAHAFLATGDDDAIIPITDRLIGEMHRFQAAAADLVDIQAGYFDGQTGIQRGGAGGVLARASGQHLSQDDFIDLLGLDAGFLQQALNDLGAENIGRNG